MALRRQDFLYPCDSVSGHPNDNKRAPEKKSEALGQYIRIARRRHQPTGGYDVASQQSIGIGLLDLSQLKLTVAAIFKHVSLRSPHNAIALLKHFQRVSNFLISHSDLFTNKLTT